MCPTQWQARARVFVQRFCGWLSLAAVLVVSACGGGDATDSPQANEAGGTVRALAASDQNATVAPGNESAYSEGGKLLRADPTIAALGPDLFGDKVNLYNGSLEFVQNDFSVPGHEKLPMGIGRRFVPGGAQPSIAAFGDWDLEIPRIHGVFSRATGWTTPGLRSGGLHNRCTNNYAPADSYDINGVNIFTAAEYWHGNFLYVPGVGSQEIIVRMPNAPSPSDGNTYALTTKNYWVFRCIPLTRGEGEGFMAISPDGTRYYFDWMVDRPYAPITRGDPLPPAAGSKPGSTASANETSKTPRPEGLLMYRKEIWILPTRVVDRFDNTVTYNYDTAMPWRLLSIVGDDPSGASRKITLHYDMGGGSPLITRAESGGRTWQYRYASGQYGVRLTSVVRPDSSSWNFDLTALQNVEPMSQDTPGCDGEAGFSASPKSGELTHPSGAKAVFVLKPTHHGRSGVPRDCRNLETNGGWSRYPLYMDAWSVASKTITGPGLDPMSWAFQYGPANASFAGCLSCPSTKTVQVTDARNVVAVHTFGNRYQVNEGQLLKLEEGYTTAGSMRTTTYTYKLSAGNFADPVGFSRQLRTAGDLAYRPTPQESKLIEQQGRAFSWVASDFDEFARPTLVTRSSGPQFTRTERTVYYDQKRLWALGQVKSLTELNTGWVAEAHEYYDDTANRKVSYNFGRKVASFEYYIDGTLKSKADPIDRKTQYSRYKRGLAQSVLHPDGNNESAEVDDLGQIRSVTNAANTTTVYDYDSMGRLSLIAPPNEPDLTYNPTLQRFEQRFVFEYGLPAGHWVQTVSTGNAVTERYFDALWRPVLTRTMDAADEANTRRVVLRRFDPDNRATFESYALRDLQTVEPVATSGVKGTERRYDALGRVIQVLQDAESNSKLTTTTNYLDGFAKEVINPRGKVTTTSFQTFDAPSEDFVSFVSAPESVFVSINRDVFGKPRAISRSGYLGANSVTRSYVYDIHQRLCKTIEPETGATVQDYDAAGNVQWRASGLNLTGVASCDQQSVPNNRKVSFTYDPRGRLQDTLYTDSPVSLPGLYDVQRTYTPDGLLETIQSEGWYWRYDYNRRRMLKTETMRFAGEDFAIKWGIDANGHIGSVKLPGGGAPALDYGPNALGDPTRVTGYASNARYHPNGALAGYTLGNGIVHSMTQNTRGLPELWVDGGVVRDRYAYDENGNVQSIADEQEGQPTRRMVYDGLDRLTNASGIWGNASYVYDAVDNMRASTVGPRSYDHRYDVTTNRLKSLTSLNANFPSLTLDYDSNGNLKQRGGDSFVFDMGNRLRFATGKAAYGYDGHGRRWWTGYTSPSTPGAYPEFNISVYSQGGKLMYEWHNKKGATWPIYMGNRLIAEFKTSTTGVSSTAFVHTDALGSPVARTTNAGATTVTRTRYEPYGGPTPNGAQQPAGIGFTGHVNDADTGLVYMQQRYYDPVAGRFLSVDQITTDTKTGGNFSRYVYANGDPYKHVDPDGRQAIITVTRDTYTANSITSRVQAASLKTGATWSGFALEDIRGGRNRDKDPIAAGTYFARVRTDGGRGWRLELQGVPNYSNVQLHVGNRARDVEGCFACGTNRGEDRVTDSAAAMTALRKLVEGDGGDVILVQVIGSSTAPAPAPATTPSSGDSGPRPPPPERQFITSRELERIRER